MSGSSTTYGQTSDKPQYLSHKDVEVDFLQKRNKIVLSVLLVPSPTFQ